MQVILTQDVAKIGKKHAVVSVSDGYARNFLIPNKKAVVATKGAVARIQKKETNAAEHTAAAQARIAKTLTDHAVEGVSIVVKANDVGTLFKKLHDTDVALTIGEKTGEAITRDMIELSEPIGTTGMHSVPVTIGTETFNIPLIVTAA